MKARGGEGEEVQFETHTTSALERVGGQRHALVALPQRNIPVIHCTGSGVGHRDGVDGYEKLCCERNLNIGPSST